MDIRALNFFKLSLSLATVQRAVIPDAAHAGDRCRDYAGPVILILLRLLDPRTFELKLATGYCYSGDVHVKF